MKKKSSFTNAARILREAYEAYLRGRFHWNQFTPDALFKAKEAFETAIKIDPDYALAYVGMTDIYVWLNIYGMIPSAEAVRLAQESALRAIAIDENLGEAYASLGLTYQNRFEWEKGYENYKRAIRTCAELRSRARMVFRFADRTRRHETRRGRNQDRGKTRSAFTSHENFNGVVFVSGASF